MIRTETRTATRTDVALAYVAIAAMLLTGLLLWDVYGPMIAFDAAISFCM